MLSTHFSTIPRDKSHKKLRQTLLLPEYKRTQIINKEQNRVK